MVNFKINVSSGQRHLPGSAKRRVGMWIPVDPNSEPVSLQKFTIHRKHGGQNICIIVLVEDNIAANIK